jgi:predicted DNA-binding transcriptional regulator AlpA
MMRRSSVSVRRNRKGHFSVKSCCTSTLGIASVSEVSNSGQRSSDEESGLQAHHQLSLAIDTPRVGVGGKAVPRQRPGREPVERAIALDEILWMRDVVQLTGKHRSTIHRWIHRGLFPRKNAPRGQPTGWLRSTIEQWLLGSPPTSPRIEPDAPL